MTFSNNTTKDEKIIEELLTRSIDTIYPSIEELKRLLLSDKKLSVYVGIDPTADYVHLGHSTNYLLLERFHKLGHKIIVLVGDFTAMIGDPSDKTSARIQLTKVEVERNLISFKEQIGKILNFEDKINPIEFKFNSQWLASMTFQQVVELASNFTVQQMMERDAFSKRVKENKPLYVHEFFYPLMQGYDSVNMNVDIEIGGTDQTFNMLAGRTLQKRYNNKNKFVITTKLFENPESGEKLMSKSKGTGIALNAEPFEMFAGVMRLPDNCIIQAFSDCTRLSMKELKSLTKLLNSNINPRDVKLELAKTIVSIYHTVEIANKAHIKWVQTVSQNEIADDIQIVKIEGKEISTVDLIISLDHTISKSAARRLIEGGGIRLDGEKLLNNNILFLKENSIIHIGKKQSFKIKL